MRTEFQQPKEREDATSASTAAIETPSLAEILTVTPAKAVFGFVSTLLATTGVCFLLIWNDLLQIHTHMGLNG